MNTYMLLSLLVVTFCTGALTEGAIHLAEEKSQQWQRWAWLAVFGAIMAVTMVYVLLRKGSQ